MESPDNRRGGAELLQKLRETARSASNRKSDQDEFAKAWKSVARSYQWAAKLRPWIGLFLMLVLVYQIYWVNCLTRRIATGEWKLDGPQLAAVIAGVISEIAAITIIFVKWLYSDPPTEP